MNAMNTAEYVLTDDEEQELLDISDAPIPWPQMQRIYALARAFGHEWASANQERMQRYDSFAQEWSVRAIARQTLSSREGRQDSIPGLCCPDDPDAEGFISHTTASGRSTWSVGSDGLTHLVVSRPQGWCLRAIVTPCGTGPRPLPRGRAEGGQGDCAITVQSLDVPHYERHVVALFDLLCPVVGSATAAKAVAPLFVGLTARYIPEKEEGQY